MVRLGGHVDPFLVLLAPLWLVWPSPLVLALAQVAVVSLGALPVFWLGRRHLGSERGGRTPRARLPRVSVDCDERRGVDPSGHVRDPALPLLRLVPRLRPTRPVRGLRCARDVDGRADGAPDRRARSLVRARARKTVGWRGHRALWRGLDLRRRLLRRPGVFAARSACSSGSTTASAARRRVSSACSSPIPLTLLGALVESHDIVYVVWLGLPLLGLFVLSPGLAAVALPQLLANGLSDFRSMTDPRYHSVAAVIPFLIAARYSASRDSAPAA